MHHLPLAVAALLVVAPPCPGQQPAPPASMFDTADWTVLFDGESLDGWVTEGGRYDGNARWSVEDGAITGREGENSAGGLIYTERRYRDFLFSCEFKITQPFDSGVFLRMVPREEDLKGPQLTLDYRSGGEVGAVYADGFLAHNDSGTELVRREAWNRLDVRCVGNFHLQAWLNGQLLTDHRLEGDPEGFARDGRIGLQVHGARGEPETSMVQFRDVRLRELPTHDPRWFRCDDRGILHLTEPGRGAGWRALFNGVDLAGWTMVGGAGEQALGAEVHDGVIHFTKQGPDGYLRTQELFGDFELRLDFKISRMCNSGLFLRSDPNGGNPSFSGCEIQILDDFNWESVTNSKLDPYQFTGGLYGSQPPAADKDFRPLGSWNTYRVRCQGPRIAAWLNDSLLWDVNTHDLKVPPGQKPFAERATEGFIGLQRHAPAQVQGDYAFFRNLFLRPLINDR